MPTTTTTKHMTQLKIREYRCSGPVDTYYTWPIRVVTSIDNAKQSRVYPPDPEWLYPTPQVKQSTEIRDYGYFLDAEDYPWGSETCNGVLKQVLRDYYNGADNGGPRQGVGPDTNWGLKARLRVKDLSVNLAQPLHEYRESAKMFHGAAVGIKKAWDTYRAAKRFRFKLTPCQVPASHLMATYGVKPLVDTLFNSVLQLQDRLSNPIYRRIVVTDKASAPVNTGVYLGQWDVSERAVIYVNFITEYSNFTFGNPLELAYESVPFSFVLDWVIPIGDYLSSLDALKEVRAMKMTLTRKEKYYHTKTEAASGKPWIRAPWVHYQSHERTVPITIPMPRIPTWEPSRSYRKIITGLNLLGSLKCKSR